MNPRDPSLFERRLRDIPVGERIELSRLTTESAVQVVAAIERGDYRLPEGVWRIEAVAGDRLFATLLRTGI